MLNIEGLSCGTLEYEEVDEKSQNMFNLLYKCFDFTQLIISSTLDSDESLATDTLKPCKTEKLTLKYSPNNSDNKSFQFLSSGLIFKVDSRFYLIRKMYFFLHNFKNRCFRFF